MSAERWLFWHRRDLRLADNLGLATAAAATPAVTGVFVLDPAILGAPDMAPARVWFLLESLRELQQSWREAGSRLFVLEGDPEQVLPQLAEALAAPVVAWNRDVEPYGRARDRRVAAALQAAGRKVLVDWDQLLVAPEALKTGGGDPYRVYGPFLRNWRGQVERKAAAGSALSGGVEPVAAPAGLVDLDPEALPEPRSALWAQLPLRDSLPTLEELSQAFDGGDLCPCRPGEAAALVQLQAFCDGGGASSSRIPLFAYEPGRNMPGEAGTSGLSAALKFGTLSPRQAWAAAQQARQVAEALGGAEEAIASIGVWEQELAWREFYQQALFHFPELAEGPYRPQWRQFPWDNHQGHYEAWCEGLTGMPIIDAAMRQLNESGWMHNRCRMIVASYLVKDLICDWRWGETAFMQRLVDGDLAANNGGWQWSASSGMDPKPLRIFNPATQASKFDPTGAYIRHWLPELRHVNTKDLLSGEIAPMERRGYPAQVVSHKKQQARFKALYASLPKPGAA
ncbi:deoxyribodipyrimidine photolyase [Synechococcus sp. CB0101]|uniref:FAD-binding domain-containing protein n=1 Tax=Synechococcus sp. CB0101 TaxID=232348 RepID=UPI000200138A|nr:FAD-binding domain-containing protein [Synechococcus sp. CB0101]QCH15145.1 deoxyribodipyrimidine photolyase [Synechococcus sp. CB0101]